MLNVTISFDDETDESKTVDNDDGGDTGGSQVLSTPPGKYEINQHSNTPIM